LLSRQLKLDTLAKAELASGLCRCVVTLGLAYLGFGVMSFVIAFLAERVLLGGLLLLVTRWQPSLVWRADGIRDISAFGFQVFAANLLWYMYSKLDTLIIGRLLGLEILGLYSMAVQISGAFQRFISSVYYRMSFPVLAQLQFSPELGTQFLKLTRYLTIVALPVFVGMAAAGHDIVAVLLDERWMGMVLSLQVLSIVAAVQTLSGLLAQAVSAVGKPKVNTMVNLVSVPLFGVSLYLGAAEWGINGVLGAWLVLMPIRYLVMIVLGCRLVQVPQKTYVLANSGPVVAVLVMSGCVVATGMSLGHWDSLPRLLVMVLVGAASYTGMSLVLYRETFLALLGMLRPQAVQVAR
jgi:O-antigen/teichoic acid export membrane protein